MVDYQPRSLVVLGTSSGVGKTLITIAICRWLYRRGVDVAPFKGMSTQADSAVFEVEGGSYLHFHQALQARGANLEPRAEMNPIAVWMTSDRLTTSVLGERNDELLTMPAERRTETARSAILTAYRRLASQHEYVVIEGCGNPVELNIKHRDVSNLWLAEATNAVCVLVGNVVETGVFAALTGTLSLMTAAERQRVIGFVVNRFMGDPRDFSDGERLLQQHTRVPSFGTLPYFAELGLLGSTPRDPAQVAKLVGAAGLDAEIDRWTDHVSRHLDLDRLLPL